MEFSAKQIAAFIQGEIIGDENATVHTFAKIEKNALNMDTKSKYKIYILSFNPVREVRFPMSARTTIGNKSPPQR